ncbi:MULTISPECIES: flagellar export protein FliJ [Stappiaceae]|jgi:flagellar FliJ protein|uniref:Flagellar FliJ protein n=2 Tax=Roseibium alexandrii TaxID=388408 RepID=A0A0M7AG21_9HYPH|nr:MULTISPECIES: flagellar export protein FliJ [Stappiaceae]OJJ10195.1 flagellar export protein FliJ [Alphaproteobacteria bacterium AO1-B]EEE45246.1 flagellar export protein FliJ [Roseibium alexandrii DFL-11]MBO9421200.1 flagellar export protein FliJ [Labrenzia sp. R4_2]MBO9426064.1 flagellar export protein FliJ [Labrenzia sp. R4_1]CTQ72574.1 flagellar biosynthesis chaperone [Roseibium alexandrii]
MKTRDSLIRLKRFQVDEKRRQLAQIESMISEFNRMADELDDQIRTEQERTGITDVSHFAYPTFAKAAADRRDNLRNSAHELDDQLQRAQDELSEAIEDLKKFEQLEERDQQRERTAQEAAEQEQLDEVAARGRSRY